MTSPHPQTPRIIPHGLQQNINGSRTKLAVCTSHDQFEHHNPYTNGDRYHNGICIALAHTRSRFIHTHCVGKTHSKVHS